MKCAYCNQEGHDTGNCPYVILEQIQELEEEYNRRLKKLKEVSSDE